MAWIEKTGPDRWRVRWRRADGVKRIARSDAVRNATVALTAWGLRGVRAAETGAEKVRLATADIVSEARAKIGEEAPAPATSNGHGHQH